MCREATISFSTNLPNIETIVSLVKKKSGIKIEYGDRNFSHHNIKEDIDISFNKEALKIHVYSYSKEFNYLEIIVIQTLIDLGGTFYTNLPTWSNHKWDELPEKLKKKWILKK